MKEVITVEIGQGGIQLGNVVWEQYCAEYGIDKTGKLDSKNAEHSFNTFFVEANNGQFVPRMIAVDLEPDVIDEIKTGSFGAIFHPAYLISGNENASNYARGYHTLGKQIFDRVNDRFHKVMDDCDNILGFVIFHSVGGGTGSGLGSLILERLSVNYRKKSVIGFEIYPSSQLSTCVIEPYNALLATHWIIDHTNVSVVLDNQAIYNICQSKLHIPKPDVSHLNYLIAKVISAMTWPIRFDREIYTDISEYEKYLAPFPRLHFMTTGMSPIVSKTDKATTLSDSEKIVAESFKPANWLVEYTKFNPEEDKYMAASLSFRGDFRMGEVNAITNWIKWNRKMCLVEWCPTGLRIGTIRIPAAILEHDDISAFTKNAIMIGNNTGISRMFAKRIVQKFDIMFSQQAFLHWYFNEEMEIGEFMEAREDLAFLEKDYMDVLSEQPSDEGPSHGESDVDGDISEFFKLISNVYFSWRKSILFIMVPLNYVSFYRNWQKKQVYFPHDQIM
ncbi:hypothetical protein RFI_05934 [Reticulomyxa filosa]|uniref:Tubulin alpha chain n=1 Tax=Reticulomyxa filosa TaxID=46433 RepID=X6NYY0_RETFI|nr:hypothetical protein RFI_05934 [Reticulomyxa filosa]|eukprot:ETO31186.1 hypothetical protein RFI_05934 [Reticulomyxa filosa]